MRRVFKRTLLSVFLLAGMIQGAFGGELLAIQKEGNEKFICEKVEIGKDWVTCLRRNEVIEIPTDLVIYIKQKHQFFTPYTPSSPDGIIYVNGYPKGLTFTCSKIEREDDWFRCKSSQEITWINKCHVERIVTKR